MYIMQSLRCINLPGLSTPIMASESSVFGVRRQHVRDNIEKEKVGWVGQDDANRSVSCDVIYRPTYSIVYFMP